MIGAVKNVVRFKLLTCELCQAKTGLCHLHTQRKLGLHQPTQAVVTLTLAIKSKIASPGGAHALFVWASPYCPLLAQSGIGKRTIGQKDCA